MDIHGIYRCDMSLLPVLDSHPCLVELHGTHFSFPLPVSRINSNLSSPYDDVVPGIPGHSESFGLGYVSCVFVSLNLSALKPNDLPLTDSPILVALISTDAVSKFGAR